MPEPLTDVLRRSEARTRALIENLPDRIALAEAIRDTTGVVLDWRYVEVSEGVLKQLGRKREEFIGKTLSEIFTSLAAGIHERWCQVLTTGQTLRYESQVLDREYVVTVFRVDANTIGSSGVDVTDRKRAERALRESDQRKSEFLALLSHELRNPLAAIHNAIYLFDHAPAGSPQEVYAKDVVRRQTKHLTKLVDDLLDLNRISHGKLTLSLSRFDARDVICRACDDVRPAFDQRGVSLTLDFASEPLWLDADVARITQIISNLLTNALKFTPPSGAVDVRLRRLGDACELSVRDTGAGIEPQIIERIFEPFEQSTRTQGRAQGGLGIGLSLVRSLVRMHGGEVRAESEGAGRGALFIVSLPLAATTLAEEAPPSIVEPSGLSVLIIEDNPDVGQALADMLAIQGHQVRLAVGGRLALAELERWTPDVLLCDVGLPDISGYEVMDHIRRLPSRSSIFAVALTGYAQPHDIERAMSAGFDAHMSKPASMERLGGILADVAARKKNA